MPKIKLIVNKMMCLGCSTCYSIHPDLFEPDSEFKAKAKNKKIDKEQVSSIISICPARAISEEEA